MVIPLKIKPHYPFQNNFFHIDDNVKMHYVDEGDGDPILMLHGNPTWSFFYRNLIKEFKSTNRVIAPDHIGCGLSDKPQDYEYTLNNHIKNVSKLIDHLNLKNITLIIHDWGGAIGCGYAITNPTNIKKMVILNTAAFTSNQIPFRINILKTPFLGELAIRALNAFAFPALFMAVTKKMSRHVRKGFLLPYSNYKNRIAVSRFVQDIPMNTKHATFALLKEIEDKLPSLTCPKLILWGAKDFCFDLNFFKKWINIYPDATHHIIENAGHYLLEDDLKCSLHHINNFIDQDNF